MGLADLGVAAYLSVTQSLNKINGRLVLREPKTSAGRRRVALSPSLVLVLRQHRCEQEALRVSLGTRLSDDDYIFCHPDGSPLDPSTVSHVFSKILRRAGLPPCLYIASGIPMQLCYPRLVYIPVLSWKG